MLALPAVARWLALGGSVSLHVAIFASGGHRANGDASATTAAVQATPDPEPERTVDFVEVTNAANVTSEGASGGGAPAGHTHDYPVAADHDARPHDPSLVHPPLGSTLAVPAASPMGHEAPLDPYGDDLAAPRSSPSGSGSSTPETPRGAVPKFALGASVRSDGAGGAAESHAGERHPHPDMDIWTESTVTERATLLSTEAPTYPEAARAAGIETTITLEIVVDSKGVVTSARATGAPSGYGFEAAATAAVGRYRFSPARVAGRAVSVRMRWPVRFELH